MFCGTMEERNHLWWNLEESFMVGLRDSDPLTLLVVYFLSQQSDHNAITSSLRSCWPPVYHSKMGNLANSVPSKLCACARAHGFQRLRTRVNILRTDTQYHDEAMF